MRSPLPALLILLSLLTLLAPATASEPPPLGHPDFLPSPERPIGWRGDGTGSWPGATPVAPWDAASGKGVVWQVDTPAAGLCQPIVVGEKVFITADPNLLCCYNVHDGSLLWQTAIDHTLQMPTGEAKQARAEQAFWDERWRLYSTWRCAVHKLEQQGKLHTIGTGFQRQGQRLPYEGEKEHEQNLQSFSGEALATYQRLQQEGTENGWCKQMGNNGPMLTHDKGKWPLAERYRAAQERWGVWYSAYNNWLGYTTSSFATPVTDGELVYVLTANNAVAAVDYAGEIRWLVWDQRPEQHGLLHTRYVASPALLRGVLVVKSSGHLRAYTAAEGRKLWEVFGPSAVAAGKKPRSNYPRCDPEGASPVLAWLGDADQGVGVVYDGGGRIWRLRDGELLAKGLGASAYNSAMLVPQDDGSAILVTKKQVFRLRHDDKGGIAHEQLWQPEASELLKFSGATLLDGKVIGQPSGKRNKGRRGQHPAYDLQTGTVSWPFGDRLRNSNYITPIGVGGVALYAFHGLNGRGHDLGQKLGAGVDGVQACTIATLDGKLVKVDQAIIDRRFQGDDEFAVLNKTHGWGYQQNASPSAQANRLFYRSRGTLWCIGDAGQRFPVPKNCPDHARVP